MRQPTNNTKILDKGVHILSFSDRKLLLCDSITNSDLPSADAVGNLEVILFCNNSRVDIAALRDYRFKAIVADGSNPLWKVEKWKAEAAQLSIPFHSTAVDGAYVLPY
jgi:hypothetical protein